MRYVKNLVLAEVATIVIGFVLVMIATIGALMITGISDYEAAREIGYSIGLVGGVLLRGAMIIVFAVTLIKTSKTTA